MTMDAEDDDALALQCAGPIANCFSRLPDGRWKQAVGFRPDVNDDGAIGRADQTEQLVGGDTIGRRHGASLSMLRTRYFSMSPHGAIACPMDLLDACPAGVSTRLGLASGHVV